MKKLFAILMVVTFMIGVVGCSKTAETTTDTAASTETTATTEAATTDTTTTDTTAEATTSDAAPKLDKSWPAETVKIGFECFDTTDEQFLAIQKYYEYLAQSYNIEIMYSESIASAEDELKFIENAASAGCKAIIGYYNVSEGQAVQLCADKQMYYWGGADKAGIYDKFVGNEYYLGGYDGGNADYESGYLMGKTLIDAGCEKLVYTSGGRDFGIDFFIDRSEGFYAAVEEAKKTNANIEVVYDVSGWPGTDAFTADQTKVCDMDIDGIANSTTALVWIQPLQAVGKFDKVKMTTMGSVNDVYKDLMAAGSVIGMAFENEEIQFGGAIPAILNAVTGNVAAAKNDGQAANYNVQRWMITSSEQFNAIYDIYATGKHFITAEEVSTCITAFDPTASYQTFVNVYSTKNIDMVK